MRYYNHNAMKGEGTLTMIWPHNHYCSFAWLNTITLICFSMPRIVALVIEIYFMQIYKRNVVNSIRMRGGVTNLAFSTSQ